ncbi:MAG TPA: hypothetical protein VFV57_12775 [Limnobacter sp.]|nr:hypothetical protein [Limnobacter sp.]
MVDVCKHIGAALGSGITSGITAVTTGTLTSAAALLGREVMKAAGDPVGDFTFKDIVLPTLVGSTIVLSGLGFLYGAVTGRQIKVTWV